MTAAWNQFDTGLADPLRQTPDALRSQWGKDLRLNSGYRDPRYNFLVGGAKNSQHLGGNAVDIDVSDWSQDDRQRFLQTASSLGFGGLGVYDNAIHLDVGPRRAWGKDRTSTSIPTWSRSVIDPHLTGGQSSGPAKPIAEQQAAGPESSVYGFGRSEAPGASDNAFDRPEKGVYGFGQSVAPSKPAATAWGKDHYGGFIDWGSGGRNYV